MDAQSKWTKQIKESPFSSTHFTDEMRYAVMQKIKENRSNSRRSFVVASSIAAAVVVITLMIGLTWINHDSPFQKTRQSAPSVENDWKPSSYFTVNGHQMLGNKGKVGLMKMNGTSDSEPFNTSKKGIVYQIYFWGSNTFNTR